MSDERIGQSITRRGVLGAALAGVLAACSAGASERHATGSALPASPNAASTPKPGSLAAAKPSVHLVDPAEVKANEVGLVPVMMYHRITAQVNGDYDTTPKDFRAGLQRMFSARYRPVRTIDLVRGTLDVPAGFTPVVLTFDDGYPDQFAADEAGNVDPDSGVGILLDVCKEFEDCPPAGSFNINKNPFGLTTPSTQRAGLATLHQLGFEIANHTFNHDDLADLGATDVQRDFVNLQRLVHDAVPGASVLTMALPFGVSPQRRALASAGSWDGERYLNEGVLDVGANPSPSPFSRTFDPAAIPRIRSMSARGGRLPLTFKYWLDALAAHPEQRYVSAGNPGHVTIPKALTPMLDARFREHAITY